MSSIFNWRALAWCFSEGTHDFSLLARTYLQSMAFRRYFIAERVPATGMRAPECGCVCACALLCACVCVHDVIARATADSYS